MRLIDADAYAYPGDLINEPTIEAETVVRCKDCRYRDPENNHCDHAGGSTIYFPRKPDDFCSYGERRADT